MRDGLRLPHGTLVWSPVSRMEVTENCLSSLTRAFSTDGSRGGSSEAVAALLPAFTGCRRAGEAEASGVGLRVKRPSFSAADKRCTWDLPRASTSSLSDPARRTRTWASGRSAPACPIESVRRIVSVGEAHVSSDEARSEWIESRLAAGRSSAHSLSGRCERVFWRRKSVAGPGVHLLRGAGDRERGPSEGRTCTRRVGESSGLFSDGADDIDAASESGAGLVRLAPPASRDGAPWLCASAPAGPRLSTVSLPKNPPAAAPRLLQPPPVEAEGKTGRAPEPVPAGAARWCSAIQVSCERQGWPQKSSPASAREGPLMFDTADDVDVVKEDGRGMWEKERERRCAHRGAGEPGPSVRPALGSEAMRWLGPRRRSVDGVRRSGEPGRSAGNVCCD